MVLFIFPVIFINIGADMAGMGANINTLFFSIPGFST
jgi:hypothetical protein